MPNISDINGVAIGSLGDFNGVAKASITDINGVTIVVSGTNLLLDTYTGAAAAYSVRKLDKDYTGNCMRIRRDSDNSETDIGFDGSGDLDTSAISTFAGSANAYCVTWYDQSGNTNNATQSTGGNQPQIYDGSAVITENGKPILITGYLSTSLSNSGDTSIFSVVKGPNVGLRSISLSRGGLLPHWGWAQAASSASASDTVTNYINGGTGSTLTRQQLHDGLNSSQASLTMIGSMAANPTVTLGWSHVLDMHKSQEFILFDSDQSSNRSGIEGNLNAYFQIGNFPNPTSGLLSTYSGAAAAYSVRQLANTAALCMRVRRDTGGGAGDDDEQDFGFDANGDLDTAAIATFVGSGNNGYVSKWYDQSGNGNDAAQSTHSYQPQIYDGSAVITENGKPALKQGLKLSSTFSSSISQPVSIYSTHVDIGINFFHDGLTNSLELRGHGGKYRINGDSSAEIVLNTPTRAALLNSQVLVYNLYEGADSEIAVDGNTAQTGTVDTNGTSGFDIHTANIVRQEFLVFEADNTNRSGIETDINNYFSIY